MLSLDPAGPVAPTLVIAVGNPGRGDDALGPELGRWLQDCAVPGVEVILDFQCQVEHAVDLAGRDRVVFVDADAAIEAPFEVRRALPAPAAGPLSHALSPEAVLHHFQSLTGLPPPEAWVVAVRGESFGLGEGLSPAARAGLPAAREALRALLG